MPSKTMLIFTMLGSLVVLFILAPLVGLVLATPPAEFVRSFTDVELLRSIGLTLGCALAATVCSTVSGVPLAYLLARKRFFGRSLIMAVMNLPIIIPHSAAGIALLIIIGRRSPLAWLSDSLVGTAPGIAVAMAFVSVPFLLNASFNGFCAVPERLEHAARTLGASPARVFFTISLPLAWRDVLSGMILMWGRGISEFGAVVIIAYYPMTTPVLVFQRFNDFGLAYARSSALMLIGVCVLVFIVLRLVARRPQQKRP